MSGKDLHNKPAFDSVPTPDWLFRVFAGFHDPFPLGEREIAHPSSGKNIFANPGYSRKMEALEWCIKWHEEGYTVVMLVPIETSTVFAKKLIQYGCERIYFERRPFPNCRGVEL